MKKKVKISLLIIIVVIILIISGLIIKKEYEKYLYHQTNEYKFLQIGYTLDEIKLLEDNLDDEHITYLINSIEKNEEYLNIISQKYFIQTNFERYLAYHKKNEDLTYENVITMVNVNRDYDMYSNIQNADTTKGYTMLVNKYYQLDSNYIPENLVSIPTTYAWGNYGDHEVCDFVLEAFYQMHEAAYNATGAWLMVNSSYRDYVSQETVWNNYKSKKGQDYADSIAARPGSSEHQTGLVLDIFSKTNSTKATFKTSEEYQWLLNNSYKYGFILRYPEGKEDITGYSFESWHYRYVGIEIATKMYEENLTFDEYYAYYLN